MVVGDSLRSVAAGIVLGAGAGWVVCSSLARWIANVEPVTPLWEVDLSGHWVGAVTNVFQENHRWRPSELGLAGREGDLFRRVIGWSMLLLAIMCVLVYLQSTAVLSWMVV